MRVEVTDLECPEGDPLGRDLWTEVARAMEAELKEAAPVRTGRLRASIKATPRDDGVDVSATDYARFQKGLEANPETVDRAVDKALDDFLE